MNSLAERGQAQLGVGLAIIVSYVEGFGFLTFNTCLSFMSGNTIQTSYSGGCGDNLLRHWCYWRDSVSAWNINSLQTQGDVPATRRRKTDAVRLIFSIVG